MYRVKKSIVFLIGLVTLIGSCSAAYWYFTKKDSKTKAAITIQRISSQDVDDVINVLSTTTRLSHKNVLSKKTYKTLLSQRVLTKTRDHYVKHVQTETSYFAGAKIDNRTLVGYILVQKISPKRAFLDFLFILPGYQGQGIGTQLTDSAIRFYQEHHPAVEEMVVTTRKKNLQGRRFYQKAGFTKATEYPEDDYILYVLTRKI